MSLVSAWNDHIREHNFRSDFFDSRSDAPELVTADPLLNVLHFDDGVETSEETFHCFFIHVNDQELRKQLKVKFDVIFGHLHIFSIFDHFDFSAFFPVCDQTEVNFQVLHIAVGIQQIFIFRGVLFGKNREHVFECHILLEEQLDENRRKVDADQITVDDGVGQQFTQKLHIFLLLFVSQYLWIDEVIVVSFAIHKSEEMILLGFELFTYHVIELSFKSSSINTFFFGKLNW